MIELIYVLAFTYSHVNPPTADLAGAVIYFTSIELQVNSKHISLGHLLFLYFSVFAKQMFKV